MPFCEGKENMQEVSHHGRIIQEYREFRAGITLEELARRIGKSRRTIVTLEQTARISDVKTRRTLAWALQIPPDLLELSDTVLSEIIVLTPVEAPATSDGKNLHRMVIETFSDNLWMRLDLYYLGSAIAAECFKQASFLAQEVESAELNALSKARQAVVYIWQKKFDAAARLYETAREITRRSPPALRAFLATGHAEVQGLLGDQSCLHSLTFARDMLGRIDPADDYLLLHHSTRCSERSINDGWSQCHTLKGKPSIAIESYEKSEKLMDLSMTRMRARLYTQYAEALYASKDLSCCFYATEELKLARAVGSQYNIRRVKDLVAKLRAQFPQDTRVRDLLVLIASK